MRLIDADEIIEKLRVFNDRTNGNEHFLNGIETAVELIEQMPTADAEPVRHGKWIDGHCSICGCDVPAYVIDWKWQKDMNARFCPMCGARMVEDDFEH